MNSDYYSIADLIGVLHRALQDSNCMDPLFVTDAHTRYDGTALEVTLQRDGQTTTYLVRIEVLS